MHDRSTEHISCKEDDENPAPRPRTEVPDEVVGFRENGSIDVVLWEDYQEGQLAGRNPTPSREATVLNKMEV